MNWFKKTGWIYFPTSLMGALLSIITIVMLIQEFIAIDRHSHSVSDTLYGFFVYFVCHIALLFWVASNTSPVKQS